MAFGQFSHLRRKPKTKTDTSVTEKPLVLIIDDDISIRRSLQIRLQSKYTLRMCENGEEGIQAVDDRVKVVILDIKMPGKDGLQVYKEIKAKFPNLPIIFYSAYQDTLEKTKVSLEYKPFRYIHKGSDIQDLLDAIEKAVLFYARMLNLADVQRQMQAFRKQE